MHASEFITGVAIVTDGKLFQLPRPKRHHHCIELAPKQLGKPVSNGTQCLFGIDPDVRMCAHDR